MTSSCLFNRGTTFCKRSHIIIMCFFPQTRSPQYKHTFCTILVDKNRQNRTFYNSVGGWITSVKRNFWLHSIWACTEQHSTYQIRWENWWLGLRIWCLGKCVGLGFMLPVAILEWKKWGGLRGQGKIRGCNINIYLAWWFFIVLKIKLLWLTLSNPT